MSFSQAETNTWILCLAKFFHKLSLETLLTILWWSPYINMDTTTIACEIKSMVLNNNWSWYASLQYYLSKWNLWEAPTRKNWVTKFWVFADEIEYKMEKNLSNVKSPKYYSIIRYVFQHNIFFIYASTYKLMLAENSNSKLKLVIINIEARNELVAQF